MVIKKAIVWAVDQLLVVWLRSKVRNAQACLVTIRWMAWSLRWVYGS